MPNKEGIINKSLPVTLEFDKEIKAKYGKMPQAFHDVYKLFERFAKLVGKVERKKAKEDFPVAWKIINVMEIKKKWD